jgi:hypothetical protein
MPWRAMTVTWISHPRRAKAAHSLAAFLLIAFYKTIIF